jgi:hypothetical protein
MQGKMGMFEIQKLNHAIPGPRLWLKGSFANSELFNTDITQTLLLGTWNLFLVNPFEFLTLVYIGKVYFFHQ